MLPLSSGTTAVLTPAHRAGPHVPACHDGGQGTRPQFIRNTCMPLTAFPATAALEEAEGYVEEARRQLHADGLPAALAWLEQTPAVSSGTARASVLQAILLALCEDSRWKIVYDEDETVGIPRATVLAYHGGLRKLQAAVDRSISTALPGFKAFNRQCAATLTRLPLRKLGDEPLAQEIARCMLWQLPAFFKIADALSADDIALVKALWHDYALDADHYIAREQALRVWKLLIIGKKVLDPNHYDYVNPSADRYAGVVIRQLRSGMPVDKVAARYPLDASVLQSWMRDNARSLQMGDALTPSASIDWSTVMPRPEAVRPAYPPR